jgi:redox-sensitive bicupin YhaK (pirin superfamily)
VLGDGDEVRARTATAGGRTRFLLVAARPIGEPVARHGPFVMNTREEIHQAVRDFQEGRIG